MERETAYRNRGTRLRARRWKKIYRVIDFPVFRWGRKKLGVEPTGRIRDQLARLCVHYTVADRAEQESGATALRDRDGRDLDYGSLWRRISDLVAALRERGIGPDDRVAVILPAGMDGTTALLGVTAGAVCVPLNPAWTRAELDQHLALVRPAILLMPQGSNLPALASARASGIPVVELADGSIVPSEDEAGKPLPFSMTSSGDTALLLQTSGTTATPKLVPLTHDMLSVSASNIGEALELSRHDRLLNVMALHHIHGISTVFAALRAGGSVCCPPVFDAEAFPSWLTDFEPTWYTAAPAIHFAVVNRFRGNEAQAAGTTLRFVRSASAPMPRKLTAELESLFGVPLIESYGMTEATAQITSNRLPPHPRKPGSAGQAAGPEVAIMDGDGRLLPAGEAGEIVIRGANVIAAYAGQDTVPAPGFPPDSFRTGDCGYLDDEGFLFVTGRLKEIINRGGEKVSPLKVEEVLMQHPGVGRAVCFPVAHPTLGEDVAAAVVPAESGQQAITSELRAFAAVRLARHQVPRHIMVVDEIPADDSGKVDRRRLLQEAWLSAPGEAMSPAPAVQAPTGVLSLAETKLLEIVSNVLGQGEIGIDDDFFLEGGDSLSAAQAAARIEQAFSEEISGGDLFEHPTVAALAELLARRMLDRAARAGAGDASDRETSVRILRRGGRGPFPVSYAQQRMWILDRLGSGSAYNVSATLDFTGDLDPERLSRSIEALSRRHDMLRAVFRMQGGQVVQDVTDAGPVPLPVIDLTTAPGDRTAEALDTARRELDRPFDLERGPVFRTTLLRLAPDRHLLVLIMHHIISDGWSRNIIHRELAMAYETGGDTLPAPPIQYTDYAAWQRDNIASGTLDKQLEYWREKLRDAPPVNGFPTVRPRPAVQSHRGASHAHGIAQPLLERLELLGRNRDATMFMTLLAAFKALFFRYTSQADCLVGTPVAGRSNEATEGLIGCFANTLVLRTDLSGNPTFDDLLARVRTTTREAYLNQELPFDKLVEALHPDRDPGRMPLFQVMFALQDLPNRGAGDSLVFGPGLVARSMPLDSPGSKFDMTVYLSRSNHGLEVTWQYNTDLFEPDTIARISRHYEAVLAAVADAPTMRIGDYPLPADHEPEDVHRPNAPALDGGFIVQFEARARATPDAVAVEDVDDAVTYAELARLADRQAARLRRLGVGRGSVVALVLPRSAGLVATLLAVWKTGATALMCDPSYPAARLAFMLSDAGAGWVIASDGALPAAVREAADNELVVVSPDVEDEDPDAGYLESMASVALHDAAYIVYTSGSSGEPKGVVIDHGNVAHYARAMAEVLAISADDRYLHTASFGFSSSIRQLVVPLGRGASVVVADEPTVRDPLVLFDTIRRRRVTVVDFVPSYLRACVLSLEALEPSSRGQLLDNDLRLSLSASEPLTLDLARAWRGLTGGRVRLVNMYGQTETTGIVATYPVDDDSSSGAVVPAGWPIPGARLYVLDAERRPVPVGVDGEIYVGGRGVGLGYVNRPHLTTERFLDDALPGSGRLYRTGDIGRCLAGGAIELGGRADEQIKLRGYRIEPREIENALCRHPSVAEAAVVLAPQEDDKSGGRLLAFVTQADSAALQPAALRAFAAHRLPAYMLPAAIVVLDALPRLAGGKLDRRALAGITADPDVAPAAQGEAPGTLTERRLAAIWMRILGVEQVGLQDNFFDLGGDSLLSIQVVQAAAEAGLNLGLGDLFRNQSLAALARTADDAAQVEAARVTQTPPPDEAEDPGRSVWVAAEALRAWGREALEAAGLDADGARIVTEVQLEASLRGQSTHNMVSIPRYARRLGAGLINPRPDIRVEHETPLSTTINGDNGPGQWVAVVAMETAIRKAREHGVGVVSVRRSNHFGAAGHYAWLAARQGLIGICTTNGPVILAPTGGLTPTFGNNPLAVGIPAGGYSPVLLDATMSVAPRGKIGLALGEGRGLSPDWILDRFGRPSTDLADLAAGLGVPIGGHKGYGLALVMETLAGVLSGAGFCLDHRRELLRQNAGPPDTGHFFLVLDPALLVPATDFTARVDRMIEQVKGGERAPDVNEILIPGEAELRSRARHLEHGVAPLRCSTFQALTKYGREASLETHLEPVD